MKFLYLVLLVTFLACGPTEKEKEDIEKEIIFSLLRQTANRSLDRASITASANPANLEGQKKPGFRFLSVLLFCAGKLY